MTPTKNPEYQQIDLKKLSLSDTNPRETIEDKTIGDLAASIKVHGVLQPLLVRPHPKKKDSFEIISGARRYKAALLAKLKEVPCRLQLGLTDEQVRAIQLVENLQRQDVPPLEEAEGIAELMKCKGYNLELIAKQIGKDVSYVAKRVKLLELVPEAKKFLKAGVLTQEHVNLLARLTPTQQREIIEQCSREWGTLVDMDPPAKMKKEIEEAYFLDLSKAPWDKADEKLVAKAGACTACPKMAGNSRSLFDDVKKGDTCTDPACFRQKFNAFIQITAAEKKIKVYKILDRWSSGDEKDILGKQDYVPCKKTDCENVAIGYYVSGDQIGKSISICAEKSCKTHKPSSRGDSGETAAQKEKRKTEEKARKQEIETRHAILADVEKSTPAKLDNEDFRVIALALWHGCRRDEQTKILKLRGWMPEKKEKGEYFDPDAWGAELIQKAEYDLHRFCIFMSLTRFMDEAPTDFDHKTMERKPAPDPLMNVAKKFNVDLDGITNVVAQGKPKAKAAAKK